MLRNCRTRPILLRGRPAAWQVPASQDSSRPRGPDMPRDSSRETFRPAVMPGATNISPNSKLFVSNLSFDATEDDVSDAFKTLGGEQPVSIRIRMHHTVF